MIELRNVTKSYVSGGGRHYIFRDLCFSFPDKVNIALIGRNGAGKTTLMRLLGGIDTPDRGRVVTDKSISWPVGLQGGFQGTLSARDNVKFACRIYGYHGEEMKRRIRFVEEFAGIGEYFDLPVKSYSSGMRSRVGFGLSMAFDFDYYLIDEVMAVGDAEFKHKSKAVMAERLQASNFILVTHAMGEVAKLCDVVVLVHGGTATLYDDVHAGIRAYQGEGKPAHPVPAGPPAGSGPGKGPKVTAPQGERAQAAGAAAGKLPAAPAGGPRTSAKVGGAAGQGRLAPVAAKTGPAPGVMREPQNLVRPA